MSDEIEETPTPASADDVQTAEAPVYRIEDDPDAPHHGDVFAKDFTLNDVLEVIFGMRGVDVTEGELALTIVLQGVVVSGTAISRQAWIDGVTAIGGDEHGTVANALRTRWADDTEMRHQTHQRRLEAGRPLYVHTYLHMKDASILPAGGTNRVVAPFWRADMNEIGGWAFGAGNFDS